MSNLKHVLITLHNKLKKYRFLHFACIITLKDIPIFCRKLFCWFSSDFTYKCQSQQIYLSILWRTCYVTSSRAKPSLLDTERNSNIMTSLVIICSSIRLHRKRRFPSSSSSKSISLVIPCTKRERFESYKYT
jgi:hypothetical protein